MKIDIPEFIFMKKNQSGVLCCKTLKIFLQNRGSKCTRKEAAEVFSETVVSFSQLTIHRC